MAEWLVEAGIGEDRAVLIEGGRIIEARILPEGELRAGTVVVARLIARMPERGQGIIAWDDHEALIRPLPAGVTQGATTLVEIVRPAIGEPGKPKRALARPAAAGATLDPGPTLVSTLDQSRASCSGEADLFETAGWSELLEDAATRMIAFPGGNVSISLSPAMTLFDVDGTLASATLAVAGAAAAAAAVRRLDISGSIGIDLPVAGDKAVRQAAAEAIDAALPQPFERTAVNGFGFVQIVRPRRRRSIAELHAMEPAAAYARALLRRAEHSRGAGERTITASPAVIEAIRLEWRAELARRLGTPVALRADPALAISAGHVQARFA